MAATLVLDLALRLLLPPGLLTLLNKLGLQRAVETLLRGLAVLLRAMLLLAQFLLRLHLLVRPLRELLVQPVLLRDTVRHNDVGHAHLNVLLLRHVVDLVRELSPGVLRGTQRRVPLRLGLRAHALHVLLRLCFELTQLLLEVSQPSVAGLELGVLLGLLLGNLLVEFLGTLICVFLTFHNLFCCLQSMLLPKNVPGERLVLHRDVKRNVHAVSINGVARSSRRRARRCRRRGHLLDAGAEHVNQLIALVNDAAPIVDVVGVLAELGAQLSGLLLQVRREGAELADVVPTLHVIHAFEARVV
eukprot:PhM_4_TR12736/c0_g1_i1/m.41748